MPSPATPPSAPTGRSRWLALAVLCAGMLMMILDETIVNVALSSIQEDLGFSTSGLAWVVNAYIVAFGGLLLLAGRLGDLVGRKRVFLAGLGVFTVASLACALAPNAAALVAARFAQGVGGALTSAVVLGMIVSLFPEPRLRATAIGAFSASAAAGGSIGLVAGGVLAQALSWHWVFIVNLPIGLTALVLAARLLPDEPGLGLRQGADAVGGVLVTAGLMVAVYAIVGAEHRGWSSATTLGTGALAVALLAGFATRQATAAQPLVPRRLVRSRSLVGANAVLGLLIAGVFGFQFMTALYLQQVLGYEPTDVGFAILPVALAIGVQSLVVAPRLLGRVGPRAVLLPGIAVVAAGLAWLARVPSDGSYATDLLPALLLLGIGFGLAMPAVTTVAMSAATERDAGLASGLFNTSQQVAAALGLAIVATAAAGRSESLLADGAARAEALTAGYHLAYAIGAGVVLTALVAAAVLLRPSAITPATATATAPEDRAGTEPAPDSEPANDGATGCVAGPASPEPAGAEAPARPAGALAGCG